VPFRGVAGLVVVLALALPAAASAHHRAPRWVPVPTGSDQQYRGLDAVDKRTAWVGGSNGEVLRTTDGGRTWQDVSPPGSAGLLFRDVEAQDARRASVLAIGEGDASRIYRTTDGGRHWQLAFVNDDPNAFYDCMTFFDQRRGLLLSDPPDGQHFLVLATEDGGLHWHETGQQMPPALPGEFAFAASGQCITTDHGHRAWFGTSAGRVFRSDDRGVSWTVAQTPVASGTGTNGIFALAFHGQEHGLAVGGDFAAPTASPDNFASTNDGGRTWQLVPGAPPEYRSGATWVDGHTAIAVGPTGSDVSTDGGTSWQRFDDGSLDTVDCASPTACWAAGADGRVAYLVR
jgi:photosystem II stability/assembly factor-like uncharacterized protein